MFFFIWNRQSCVLDTLQIVIWFFIQGKNIGSAPSKKALCLSVDVKEDFEEETNIRLTK